MTPERRARRLAWLYPSAWRRRFPDFVDVLAADLVERRPGVLLDVVRGAALERLRVAGLLPNGAADRGRSGLALVYASLLPFVGLAVGMWSQLHTAVFQVGGAAPAQLRSSELLLAVTTGAVLTSQVAVVGLVVGQALGRRGAASPGAGAAGPGYRLALMVAGSIGWSSLAGWAADRSGWYSPAAAGLPGSGVGHVATLWLRGVIAGITPAWVHPGLFGRMPAGELLAALTSPVAASVAAVALLHLIRRLAPRCPTPVHAVVAVITSGAMLLTVAAAVHWLVTHGGSRADSPAPGHTAWTVVAVLAVLAVTALVGSRRILRGPASEPWPAVRPGHPDRMADRRLTAAVDR